MIDSVSIRIASFFLSYRFTPGYKQVEIEQNGEFVALLLKSGAEFDMRNIEGEIPLDIASNAGYDRIVDMLRAAALTTL